VTGPGAVRLALRFDAAALAADVATLPDDAWVPHFNTQLFTGEWSGVALRTGAGSPLALYPDPTSEAFEDAPVLGSLDAVRAVLASLRCPLQTARFLRLGAGATILPHRDHRLGLAHGEVRLHVPITGEEHATLWVDDHIVRMAPGELWYVDVDRVHRAHNAGPAHRVHLVVDCTVDAWLADAIAGGDPLDTT
jgi:hypothetical protein